MSSLNILSNRTLFYYPAAALLSRCGFVTLFDELSRRNTAQVNTEHDTRKVKCCESQTIRECGLAAPVRTAAVIRSSGATPGRLS